MSNGGVCRTAPAKPGLLTRPGYCIVRDPNKRQMKKYQS